MRSSETTREQNILRGYDPLRQEMHWKLICYGAVLGLLTAAWWYNAIQQAPSLEVAALNLHSDTSTTIWLSPPAGAVAGIIWLSLIPVCLIVGEVLIFRRSRKAQVRILRLRMTALEGTARVCSSPLTAPFPITLPYTIHMRIKKVRIKKVFFKRYSSGWLGLLIIFIVIFSNGKYTDLSTLFQFCLVELTSPIVLLLLFAQLLLGPIWFIWTYVTARWGSPTLTLNDEKITAHYWSDRVTMRWDEVRSFALADQDKPGSAPTFELSDGENIIRWVDISSLAINPYAPTMEPAQYAALMQTLPHWICTRTGLPLYDLRTSNASGVKEE